MLRPTQAARSMPSRGFTLLEILLAFALISLVVGVFVLNVDKMVARDPVGEWERTFFMAEQEARLEALRSGFSPKLSFNPEAGVLVLRSGGKTRTFSPPSYEEGEEPEVSVRWEVLLPFEGSGPSEDEWKEVPSIPYDHQGISPHFRVRLEVNGNTQSWRLDPFTGSLWEKEAKG